MYKIHTYPYQQFLMSSDQSQVKFNNYLVELIKKLQATIPSEKKLFTKYYKYYRDQVEQDKRIEFITEFIKYLSKYHKEFSTCDEGLFSEEDEYYPGKPIQLMKGIDFKKIWRAETLTDESKNSLWKYLQTLYLLGTSILKENEAYEQLTKQQRELFTNLLESMKCEKRIKEDAEKQEEEESKSSGGFDLGDIFDGDNVITQIAQEIAKECNLVGDLGGLGGDPLTAIRTLFSQDNTKLQEIINRVSQKLNTVLREKGLSEQELLEQAQTMHSKLLGKFKGIPGMPDLESLTKKMVNDLGQKMAPQGPTEPADAPRAPEVSVDDLTNNIKTHFSQMGFGNFDDIQKMMNQILTAQTESENDPPAVETSLSDDEDHELAKLKKKVSRKK